MKKQRQVTKLSSSDSTLCKKFENIWDSMSTLDDESLLDLTREFMTDLVITEWKAGMYDEIEQMYESLLNQFSFDKGEFN